MQTQALLSETAFELTYQNNVFHSYFESIAEQILNSTVLTINHNRKYRILEVEFYLYDGLIHQDTFTSDILRNEQRPTVYKHDGKKMC